MRRKRVIAGDYAVDAGNSHMRFYDVTSRSYVNLDDPYPHLALVGGGGGRWGTTLTGALARSGSPQLAFLASFPCPNFPYCKRGVGLEPRLGATILQVQVVSIATLPLFINVAILDVRILSE